MKLACDSSATLEEFLDQIGNLFEADVVEATARDTQFVQRRSKLTGHIFLTSFVFGVMMYKTPTLEQLTGLINQVLKNYGEHLTRNGLHERLTDHAVEFFTSMLSHVIRIQLPSSKILKALKDFDAVILVDSTSITLPENLAFLFAGAGGKASSAGLKIQFGYDLKSCRMFYRVQAGTRPDNAPENSVVAEVPPGALRVTDLGYFLQEGFVRLHQKGAYFLSRLKSGVTVYRRTADDLLAPINLSALIKEFSSSGAEWRECEVVLVSHHVALPIRLIMESVPPEVLQQRIRRLNRDNRRKGRQTTPAAKLWASVSLYITNAPVRKLAGSACRLLYTVRWQIELVFTLWKSEFALAQIRGHQKERVLCTLYAKLFGAFLTAKLTTWVRNTVWNTARKEVSEYRAAKVLHTFLPRWYRTVFQSPLQGAALLREALAEMGTCFKSSQTTRQYPLERLGEVFE